MQPQNLPNYKDAADAAGIYYCNQGFHPDFVTGMKVDAVRTLQFRDNLGFKGEDSVKLAMRKLNFQTCDPDFEVFEAFTMLVNEAHSLPVEELQQIAAGHHEKVALYGAKHFCTVLV